MSYSLKDILKSLKVLFISKRENITSSEIDILEMFFHKIIFSYTSLKALDIFSKEHPDVIITDIKFEELSGIDL